MILAENDKGFLQFATNELRVNSKEEDPAAVRGGAPSGIALIKFSGDRLTFLPEGTRHDEMVLVQFKQDERTRDNPDCLWGEATVHMRGPEGDEGGMYHIATIRHDGIQLHVPITTVTGITA